MSLWPLTLFGFATVLSVAGCLWQIHLDRARSRHEAAHTIRKYRTPLSDMYPPRSTVDVILWEKALLDDQRDRAQARAHMHRLRALQASLARTWPNVDSMGRTRKVGTSWDDPKGAA